jgi:hypothetical protein
MWGVAYNCGGLSLIAKAGEPAYLSTPTTVTLATRQVRSSGRIPCGQPGAPAYGIPDLYQLATVSAPAGAIQCDAATFGLDRISDPSVTGCFVRLPAMVTAPPGNATKVADQGGAFTVGPDGGTVYYGVSGAGGSALIPRDVPGGSFECTNALFGPDPAYNVRKVCLLAPHPPTVAPPPITYYDTLNLQAQAMQRAQVAAAAQQEVAAAQAVTIATPVDQAAADAIVAQNAQAQASAAQQAAEAYRQVQLSAQAQAEQLAAQLATFQAAALAPAIAEETKQQVAQGQLIAAQTGAAAQAAASLPGGLSTTDLLLYGGLALAALLLLKG